MFLKNILLQKIYENLTRQRKEKLYEDFVIYFTPEGKHFAEVPASVGDPSSVEEALSSE